MADFFGDKFQSAGAQSSLSETRPTSTHRETSSATMSQADSDNVHLPRTKRIACVVCRRRKLRCDGKRPSCGTCSRLAHECAYDEVRKKSGPKRGYVKQLEARLAQVENLLRTQEPNTTQPPETHTDVPSSIDNEMTIIPDIPSLANEMSNSLSPPQPIIDHQASSQLYLPSDLNTASSFGWDMLSLGLEEPLPTQDVIDELNQIYFEKVHPSLSLLHRPRHLAAMNLAYNIRPPVCLQYITWCHAASVSDKYSNLHGLFYQRARKYTELDEMKGLGESIVSLAHCQTWILISAYEFKMMYFPRAWLSSGKATRLALMMGLNRLDGLGPEVKQSLPPARDWTEKEERRRTFWMAFCVDRYASAGTGWPVVIDERDILTNLPASETSFVKSKPERTLRLSSVILGEGIPTLSPLASVALLACMFGRNLTHLHRPDPQDNDHDLNGEFWKRHRGLDNILLHFALTMPSHLRLPAGISDPNVIFTNMAIHTSTICLHQAAIFKAEKNKMPSQIITESKRRCIVAADQISSIMKMISHTDLTLMNPFMSFCVYVAARVFVQYLQSRPDDSAARSSLQFFFSALDALKNKNPMTESFLVQLDVDIEGSAFRDIRHPKFNSAAQSFTNATAKCVAILPIAGCQFGDHGDTGGNQPGLQTPTSLPSRQRQAPLQNQNTESQSVGVTQVYTETAYTLSSGPETVGSGSGTDIEISPRFDDHGNLISDGSTSSGPKSSSNTSYLEASCTSSPKGQQQSPVDFPNQASRNPLDARKSGQVLSGLANAAQFANLPYGDNIFSTDTIPSIDASMPEAPFPIPPSWDFGATQTSSADAINITPETMRSLSEGQWAQLLSSNNWDAWRNQS
ncbi:putative C6 transcription factor Prf [Aspergillus clavatus NRRL 1]|uniref:C6 transcription factor Prf, putative n=1 Tax=Aspergillus clavatus (strain ATCC 1007 / CBS 513.65 / DSM 816 / NCTC 3887 / NRRL 1 / QM 1276 / 107) TaxID=344612 RepID=A1CIE1_ASPCL|nr:C6 transcription factor Prf, putative [Aspergillus clavatus NRRL 1]EAW10646.1 C6 transcription factor Prf, putative [Aspergillus clavatus NRRL 1]